tara:strand:+ start:93488 stop:93976 length:489 start_codon:yes stop_codon:yes gene_type:complete
MIIPFEKMREDSRVWIFQSSSLIVSDKKRILIKDIEFFLSDWTSHGHKIESSYKIKYERFLIIALNDSHTNPSGCSIDKLINFIKYLENKNNLDFLDRLSVAFKIKNEIKCHMINQIPDLLKCGDINSETIVFNNLVKNKHEFLSFWETPMSESWHKKYLKN